MPHFNHFLLRRRADADLSMVSLERSVVMAGVFLTKKIRCEWELILPTQ
jgi:hypothetical protein